MLTSLQVCFNAVAPLFLIMALGYGAKCLGAISVDAVPSLNKLAFRYFMPVMLFRNLYDSSLSHAVQPRLLLFAVISHFAYTFAFGIPFIPFTTTAFNQTSVIWSLFWGLMLLKMNDSDKFKGWQKAVIVVLVCLISFCSDWSCIATVAIVYIGAYRGSFKKQMTWMMVWVAVYAAVYFFFIDKIYAAVQLFAALSIPLLKSYNGERGSWKGMKWLFYIYYPAHLIACGIIRLLLHGNISIMIGG